MGATADILAEVRAQIDAHPEPLREARLRLNLVKDCATGYPGSLRTYSSGSLAMHTMNHPVTDGDGGLVLDRRSYPNLGPDGGGESPHAVVDDICRAIGPKIRDVYPAARVSESKRGPMITFSEPVEGQDPTVDLVVALTRQEGNGLWIPNLKADKWEASDPERHVTLLGSGTPSHCSLRRQVIRLAKAWNKQYTEPGVSSFMLSVWAYEFMDTGMGVPAGLLALFNKAAARLRAHQPTRDPAGVSPNLKLLLPPEIVLPRLEKAAAGLSEAISNDADEEAARKALAGVYWRYLDDDLSRAASSLSAGKALSAGALGLTGIAATVPPTRSFGGECP
jgi:hypothetical protein